MAELIDPDPPVIIHGVDEEIAAWKAVRHGESALAGVDDDGRFTGLIPPRRIVEVLLQVHDEDLARLGGYLASTSSARHATEEPVAPRIRHRLPWLLSASPGRSLTEPICGPPRQRLARQRASIVPTPFGAIKHADRSPGVS
jgi:magnesium transporter